MVLQISLCRILNIHRKPYISNNTAYLLLNVFESWAFKKTNWESYLQKQKLQCVSLCVSSGAFSFRMRKSHYKCVSVCLKVSLCHLGFKADTEGFCRITEPIFPESVSYLPVYLSCLFAARSLWIILTSLHGRTILQEPFLCVWHRHLGNSENPSEPNTLKIYARWISISECNQFRDTLIGWF